MTNLTEIKHWNLVTAKSKWINVNLCDTLYPLNANHFSFRCDTKNSYDILNSTFSLLDRKDDLIKFDQDEKKVPVLSFKIQNVK